MTANGADGMERVDCDVAIIGHGPVGSALAILLAQYGHTVTVLERWPVPYSLPRAVHFDDEIARILQACGIGAALDEISEPVDVYEWRNAAGLPLARFGRSGVGPSGWPSSSMFHQPDLEARLGDRARDLSTLVLRRGVEAVGLTQSDKDVTIHARSHDGGAFDVRCRYAVGCDGSNSTVRQLLDLPTIDLGFSYDWLIVDIVLHELRVFDPINVQMCDPTRPTTVVSGGPGRRRWEFMRRPDETVDDLEKADAAWRLLAPWDVTPDNATLERHAVYTFNACHAARWQNGRVLLAGDAAHLMPPFAGQGMCSGIRDVANLAWKLDLALGGRGDDSVLDSYTDERLPHARAVIDFSIELGKIICVSDPAEAAARDELMIGGFTETAISIPPLPPIAGALLHADDPVAGHLFPQGMVSVDGARARFDDVHGVGWRMVTVTTDRLELDAALEEWFDAESGTVVAISPDADVDGAYATWFAEHSCTWALQRPDFHVQGAASDVDGAEALLVDLRRRLTTPSTRTSSPPSSPSQS